MGFAWDPRAFTLASDRLTSLADDADAYLYDRLDPMFTWNRGPFLLNALMIHHQHLKAELAASASCTSAMLRAFAENIDDAGSVYARSEDAGQERFNEFWDDLGFDLPERGDANLERYDQGGYNFGAEMPRGEYNNTADYTIEDIVNLLLGLPKSAIPAVRLESARLQAVWDDTFGLWQDLGALIALLLSGDWESAHGAGDAMCDAAVYWNDLGEVTRRAAGTLFGAGNWDGTASERAEWFAGKICDLYIDAAGEVERCGRAYQDNAHGCYLLFHEIYGILAGIPDDLYKLVSLLEKMDHRGDLGLKPAAELAGVAVNVYRTVKLITGSIGRAVQKLLIVAQVVEAAVAILISATPLITNYTNEMRGATD